MTDKSQGIRQAWRARFQAVKFSWVDVVSLVTCCLWYWHLYHIDRLWRTVT